MIPREAGRPPLPSVTFNVPFDEPEELVINNRHLIITRKHVFQLVAFSFVWIITLVIVYFLIK